MPLPSRNNIDHISSALTVASLRHQVIASNIANRDTQGYQRLTLRFADTLNAVGSTHVVSDVRSPELPAASLEDDLLALSNNAMNYQVLAKALSNYFKIAETIASGGRA